MLFRINCCWIKLTRLIYSRFGLKNLLTGTQNYAKVLFDALDFYRPDKNSIFIGDFNIGGNDEHPERYEELIREFGKFNLINASLGTEFEYTNTHWNASTKKYYQNDFCFCTNDLAVKEFNIPKKDEWVAVGETHKWDKTFDHCPIIVEFD